MSDNIRQELLALTQRLLDCIANRDWASYEELCDPSLTAFEPEAIGHLVQGLAFHRFYFDLGGAPGSAHNTTLSSPHVRVMGDVAVVSYVRLNQRLAAGQPYTSGSEETRVWQRRDGRWRHVHFHRSALGVG